MRDMGWEGHQEEKINLCAGKRVVTAIERGLQVQREQIENGQSEVDVLHVHRSLQK